MFVVKIQETFIYNCCKLELCLIIILILRFRKKTFPNHHQLFSCRKQPFREANTRRAVQLNMYYIFECEIVKISAF